MSFNTFLNSVNDLGLEFSRLQIRFAYDFHHQMCEPALDFLLNNDPETVDLYIIQEDYTMPIDTSFHTNIQTKGKKNKKKSTFEAFPALGAAPKPTTVTAWGQPPGNTKPAVPIETLQLQTDNNTSNTTSSGTVPTNTKPTDNTNAINNTTTTTVVIDGDTINDSTSTTKQPSSPLPTTTTTTSTVQSSTPATPIKSAWGNVPMASPGTGLVKSAWGSAPLQTPVKSTTTQGPSSPTQQTSAPPLPRDINKLIEQDNKDKQEQSVKDNYFATGSTPSSSIFSSPKATTNVNNTSTPFGHGARNMSYKETDFFNQKLDMCLSIQELLLDHDIFYEVDVILALFDQMVMVYGDGYRVSNDYGNKYLVSTPIHSQVHHYDYNYRGRGDDFDDHNGKGGGKRGGKANWDKYEVPHLQNLKISSLYKQNKDRINTYAQRLQHHTNIDHLNDHGETLSHLSGGSRSSQNSKNSKSSQNDDGFTRLSHSSHGSKGSKGSKVSRHSRGSKGNKNNGKKANNKVSGRKGSNDGSNSTSTGPNTPNSAHSGRKQQQVPLDEFLLNPNQFDHDDDTKSKGSSKNRVQSDDDDRDDDELSSNNKINSANANEKDDNISHKSAKQRYSRGSMPDDDDIWSEYSSDDEYDDDIYDIISLSQTSHSLLNKKLFLKKHQRSVSKNDSDTANDKLSTGLKQRSNYNDNSTVNDNNNNNNNNDNLGYTQDAGKYDDNGYYNDDNEYHWYDNELYYSDDDYDDFYLRSHYGINKYTHFNNYQLLNNPKYTNAYYQTQRLLKKMDKNVDQKEKQNQNQNQESKNADDFTQLHSPHNIPILIPRSSVHALPVDETPPDITVVTPVSNVDNHLDYDNQDNHDQGDEQIDAIIVFDQNANIQSDITTDQNEIVSEIDQNTNTDEPIPTKKPHKKKKINITTQIISNNSSFSNQYVDGYDEHDDEGKGDIDINTTTTTNKTKTHVFPPLFDGDDETNTQNPIKDNQTCIKKTTSSVQPIRPSRYDDDIDGCEEYDDTTSFKHDDSNQYYDDLSDDYHDGGYNDFVWGKKNTHNKQYSNPQSRKYSHKIGPNTRDLVARRNYEDNCAKKAQIKNGKNVHDGQNVQNKKTDGINSNTVVLSSGVVLLGGFDDKNVTSREGKNNNKKMNSNDRYNKGSQIGVGMLDQIDGKKIVGDMVGESNDDGGPENENNNVRIDYGGDSIEIQALFPEELGHDSTDDMFTGGDCMNENDKFNSDGDSLHNTSIKLLGMNEKPRTIATSGRTMTSAMSTVILNQSNLNPSLHNKPTPFYIHLVTEHDENCKKDLIKKEQEKEKLIHQLATNTNVLGDSNNKDQNSSSKHKDQISSPTTVMMNDSAGKGNGTNVTGQSIIKSELGLLGNSLPSHFNNKIPFSVDDFFQFALESSVNLQSLQDTTVPIHTTNEKEEEEMIHEPNYIFSQLLHTNAYEFNTISLFGSLSTSLVDGILSYLNPVEIQITLAFIEQSQELISNKINTIITEADIYTQKHKDMIDATLSVNNNNNNNNNNSKNALQPTNSNTSNTQQQQHPPTSTSPLFSHYANFPTLPSGSILDQFLLPNTVDIEFNIIQKWDNEFRKKFEPFKSTLRYLHIGHHAYSSFQRHIIKYCLGVTSLTMSTGMRPKDPLAVLDGSNEGTKTNNDEKQQLEQNSNSNTVFMTPNKSTQSTNTTSNKKNKNNNQNVKNSTNKTAKLSTPAIPPPTTSKKHLSRREKVDLLSQEQQLFFYQKTTDELRDYYDTSYFGYILSLFPNITNLTLDNCIPRNEDDLYTFLQSLPECLQSLTLYNVDLETHLWRELGAKLRNSSVQRLVINSCAIYDMCISQLSCCFDQLVELSIIKAPKLTDKSFTLILNSGIDIIRMNRCHAISGIPLLHLPIGSQKQTTHSNDQTKEYSLLDNNKTYKHHNNTMVYESQNGENQNYNDKKSSYNNDSMNHKDGSTYTGLENVNSYLRYPQKSTITQSVTRSIMNPPSTSFDSYFTSNLIENVTGTNTTPQKLYKSNEISTLEITNCQGIDYICLSSSRIHTLIINTTNIKTLILLMPNLKFLDISDNSALTRFSSYLPLLHTLIMRQNPALRSFSTDILPFQPRDIILPFLVSQIHSELQSLYTSINMSTAKDTKSMGNIPVDGNDEMANDQFDENPNTSTISTTNNNNDQVDGKNSIPANSNKTTKKQQKQEKAKNGFVIPCATQQYQAQTSSITYTLPIIGNLCSINPSNWNISSVHALSRVVLEASAMKPNLHQYHQTRSRFTIGRSVLDLGINIALVPHIQLATVIDLRYEPKLMTLCRDKYRTLVRLTQAFQRDIIKLDRSTDNQGVVNATRITYEGLCGILDKDKNDLSNPHHVKQFLPRTSILPEYLISQLQQNNTNNHVVNAHDEYDAVDRHFQNNNFQNNNFQNNNNNSHFGYTYESYLPELPRHNHPQDNNNHPLYVIPGFYSSHLYTPKYVSPPEALSLSVYTDILKHYICRTKRIWQLQSHVELLLPAWHALTIKVITNVIGVWFNTYIKELNNSSFSGTVSTYSLLNGPNLFDTSKTDNNNASTCVEIKESLKDATNLTISSQLGLINHRVPFHNYFSHNKMMSEIDYFNLFESDNDDIDDGLPIGDYNHDQIDPFMIEEDLLTDINQSIASTPLPLPSSELITLGELVDIDFLDENPHSDHNNNKNNNDNNDENNHNENLSTALFDQANMNKAKNKNDHDSDLTSEPPSTLITPLDSLPITTSDLQPLLSPIIKPDGSMDKKQPLHPYIPTNLQSFLNECDQSVFDSMFPSLQYVDVTNCPKLTPKMIQHLITCNNSLSTLMFGQTRLNQSMEALNNNRKAIDNNTILSPITQNNPFSTQTPSFSALTPSLGPSLGPLSPQLPSTLSPSLLSPQPQSYPGTTIQFPLQPSQYNSQKSCANNFDPKMQQQQQQQTKPLIIVGYEDTIKPHPTHGAEILTPLCPDNTTPITKCELFTGSYVIAPAYTSVKDCSGVVGGGKDKKKTGDKSKNNDKIVGTSSNNDKSWRHNPLGSPPPPLFIPNMLKTSQNNTNNKKPSLSFLQRFQIDMKAYMTSYSYVNLSYQELLNNLDQVHGTVGTDVCSSKTTTTTTTTTSNNNKSIHHNDAIPTIDIDQTMDMNNDRTKSNKNNKQDEHHNSKVPIMILPAQMVSHYSTSSYEQTLMAQQLSSHSSINSITSNNDNNNNKYGSDLILDDDRHDSNYYSELFSIIGINHDGNTYESSSFGHDQHV